MKNLLVFTALIFIAQNSIANTDEYQTLLAKHASSGHISAQDVINQDRENLETQTAQPKFNLTVRSVASTITKQDESIKLINPVIEISTK